MQRVPGVEHYRAAAQRERSTEGRLSERVSDPPGEVSAVSQSIVEANSPAVDQEIRNGRVDTKLADSGTEGGCS
jgi:hypothetical protein